MATHTVASHLSSIRLFVLLRRQKLRSFNFVNLHKLLSRFGHRVPSIFSHAEPFVETLQLFVLLNYILNISLC